MTDQLTDRKQKLRDDIAAAHAEALEAITGRGTEAFERAGVNNDWNAKDVVAHLSTIELRIRAMCQGGLAGEPWPEEDRDVHTFNARCVEERHSWSIERLVDELRASGLATLAFMDSLRPADLDFQFPHPTKGSVTVEAMLNIIPRHLREHTREIRAALAG